MTPEQLTATGRHWQKLLRLDHWDIAFLMVRAHEIDGSQGRCSARSTKWQATIKIVGPADAENVTAPEFPQDIERTVVHELLHLHLWHCGLKADTPDGDAEERAVDRLASVLVGLHRAPSTSDASGQPVGTL